MRRTVMSTRFGRSGFRAPKQTLREAFERQLTKPTSRLPARVHCREAHAFCAFHTTAQRCQTHAQAARPLSFRSCMPHVWCALVEHPVSRC